MSEPKGSVPDILSGYNGNVVLRPMSPDSFDGVFSITWDRLVGEEIVTITYDGQTGEQQFVGIPALGSFERLVVSTPYVEWNADMIVRTGDFMVRFTDHVLLERQSPIQIEHGQEQSSFTFDVSTHRLDGSFVEIIAPEGMGKEQEIAFTVLALLALVVGDAVVGDIVQLDSLSSTPLGTEYAVRFPHLRAPFKSQVGGH